MNHGGEEFDLTAATNRILAVKQVYEDELLSKPNVVGVAIGYSQIGGQTTDKLALVVLVTNKVPQTTLKPEDQIPISIEGIPIDVQEVGEITAN
jgi:hypothetical protein